MKNILQSEFCFHWSLTFVSLFVTVSISICWTYFLKWLRYRTDDNRFPIAKLSDQDKLRYNNEFDHLICQILDKYVTNYITSISKIIISYLQSKEDIKFKCNIFNPNFEEKAEKNAIKYRNRAISIYKFGIKMLFFYGMIVILIKITSIVILVIKFIEYCKNVNNNNWERFIIYCSLTFLYNWFVPIGLIFGEILYYHHFKTPKWTYYLTNNVHHRLYLYGSSDTMFRIVLCLLCIMLLSFVAFGLATILAFCIAGLVMFPQWTVLFWITVLVYRLVLKFNPTKVVRAICIILQIHCLYVSLILSFWSFVSFISINDRSYVKSMKYAFYSDYCGNNEWFVMDWNSSSAWVLFLSFLICV